MSMEANVTYIFNSFRRAKSKIDLKVLRVFCLYVLRILKENIPWLARSFLR